MLSAEQVRDKFSYDPETGILTRKVRAAGVKPKVGSVRSDGYRSVEVDGISHYEHRLIWLLVFGEWPCRHIDHINGSRSDNRISNLRLATVAENAQNRKLRSDNKAGLTGVRKQGKSWLAQISVKGKKTYLGSFGSISEAHAAYLMAKSKLHEFQPTQR